MVMLPSNNLDPKTTYIIAIAPLPIKDQQFNPDCCIKKKKEEEDMIWQSHFSSI